MEKKSYVFKCYNDLKHKNKLALEFYVKIKFDRLEWSKYSPDLNPREDACKKLSNKKIFIAQVNEICANLDLELIENSIQCMLLN